MIMRARAAIVMVLLIISASETKSFAQAELRVGIIGDQTGVDSGSSPADLQQNLTAAYEKLKSGVDLLSRNHVVAVIHVGDLLEDSVSKSEQDYDAQFSAATKILDQLNVPYFLTPGDHDVNPPGDYTPDSPKSAYRTYLERLYAKKFLTTDQRLYYSFNVNGFHFVALDSLEHLRTDPRWGDIFLSQISAEQFEWLKRDLEAHRTANAIVVFTHQPLWYNWTGWSKVHRLLRSFPVRAVIAGHFHYSQDDGQLDGIRYVVVGATGADVKQGNAAAGNVQQITLMTLKKNGPASFHSLALDSGVAIPMNSRADMDRVQALDTMLDNNYYKNYNEFGPCNPLCLIDGALYADAQKDPPQLRLCGLGNPVDVPVEVSIDQPSDWALIGPSFREGPNGCKVGGAAVSCTLPAASGILSSNDSSVSTSDPPPAPLWKAGLAPKGSGNKTTSVILSLRLSFNGETGTSYSLERKLLAQVAATCGVAPTQSCSSSVWQQCESAK
jgi:hypothetical protein